MKGGFTVHSPHICTTFQCSLLNVSAPPCSTPIYKCLAMPLDPLPVADRYYALLIHGIDCISIQEQNLDTCNCGVKIISPSDAGEEIQPCQFSLFYSPSLKLFDTLHH